jgi:hypothetical protein
VIDTIENCQYYSLKEYKAVYQRNGRPNQLQSDSSLK